MVKSLFSIIVILTIVFGNKHHKSKSVHFPKSHIVQQGRWEPNREAGFHASNLCTSHFCYDEIRDETCDSTSTVCDDSASLVHFGKTSRKLLQETESCTEAEGCGCLETLDSGYHCLAEEACDSETTTNECEADSDCGEGEYCADACCGYYQCLTLCCDGDFSTTTEKPETTDEPETTTEEPETTDEPETTTDEYPETTPRTTSDEYLETTPRPETEQSKLMNSHSIHKHGGDDDKPEDPPQTADEDAVEPPPAVEEEPNDNDKLLFRLKEKSGQPQPIASSPQTADEDGVEPPPAVEEEPAFSMSNKKRDRRKKKFGSLDVAAPPRKIEDPPQTADEDGVEPPPEVEEDDDNDDNDDSNSKHKHKKSKVLPFVYFGPFLLVAAIVGIAFLVKFYFDKHFYKNKLLSVDEKNENVPLISKVTTYQATN